jgi:hypothetical protein
MKINIEKGEVTQNVVNQYTYYADDIPVIIKYRDKQKQMLVPRNVDEDLYYSGHTYDGFSSGSGGINKRLGGADVEVTLEQTFALQDPALNERD